MEWRRADTLKNNPFNWRRHPPEQLAALRDLITDDQIGWAGALLFNERTGRLIDGHGRLKIARPDELVPVMIGDWPEDAEKKILLTLDPISKMAGLDPDALEDLLADVDLDTDALLAVGQSLTDELERFEAETADDTDSGDGGGKKKSATITSSYHVVCQCGSEADQQKIYDLLTGKGYTCKLATI